MILWRLSKKSINFCFSQISADFIADLRRSNELNYISGSCISF